MGEAAVTPHHAVDRADASVVAYHRTLLDRALRTIARAYQLQAWAVTDASGEVVGPLFEVKCNLCTGTAGTIIAREADPVVVWWRGHWDAHHVNGGRDA